VGGYFLNHDSSICEDATRLTRARAVRVSRAQPGEKKGFFDWLLEKSCRDSSVIGAGYEDDLKSGAFKPKGGLDISEGGSFKI